MSHNRSKQKQKEEDGEDATSLSVQLGGDDLEAEGHEEKNRLEEEEEELLGPAGEAEEGRSLLGGIETARLRRYVQEKMELAEQAKLPATLEEILEEAVQKKMKKLQPIYLKNYWKLLLVVGFFYALPAVQFVIFQYRAKETTSTVDCYYNFKCAKRLLGFDAFNNILSNAGYLIAGFSFIVIVFFTHQCGPGGNYYGLHSDPSLYYAVGLAIVWEGVFSGLYHVCPSRVNFQFDTAFMLIGTGVLFITLFQKRHPTSAPGTIRAFLFFAFLILLTSLALTGIPLAVFWTLTLVLLSPFYLQGTWQFYYHKKITPWEYVALIKVRPFRVKQKLRFLAVLIGSAITIAIIVAGIVKSTETEELENFPLTLLAILVINTFGYVFYYVLMKFRYREKVHWVVLLLFLLVLASWIPAIYFFTRQSTNKFKTPEESAALNKPCIVFNFFDTHDMWHFLSAIGLFCIAMLVYLLDMGIKDKPFERLPLF